MSKLRSVNPRRPCLRQLTAARDAAGNSAEQLEAVLTAFALIQHEHHGTDLPVSLLHRGGHVDRARQLT